MERKIVVNSYTNIKAYFLAYWVSVIGPGPAMLYLQLLSYCHKGKDIAWPSIQTLNKRMGTSTKTLIKYRHTLQANNYPHPESDRREDEEEETKTEEIESERIMSPKRGKEEIKRLSREEELAWIKNIRNNVSEACQMPKG